MIANIQLLETRGYALQDCGGGCRGHVKQGSWAVITIGDAATDGAPITSATTYFGASIDTPEGQIGGCEDADLEAVIDEAENIAALAEV